MKKLAKILSMVILPCYVESKSKQGKDEEAPKETTYLSLESLNEEKNTLEVIDFVLFCRILNDLHMKVSQEIKFKSKVFHIISGI